MAALVVHGLFARALVLYFVAVGTWGVVAWRRGEGVSASYRGALVIGWLMVLVQGILGAFAALDAAPRESLHLLYGVAMAVAVPAGALYSRGREPARQSLVLALTALFTSGLAIRGITTS